jgi:hypothetical protein
MGAGKLQGGADTCSDGESVAAMGASMHWPRT